MAQHWESEFVTVPRVNELTWHHYLSEAPRHAWPSIPLDEALMHKLLPTFLRAILGGAQLPSSWTDSHVVFLPKGQGSCLESDQWRPLCLANTCFKLLQGHVLELLTPLGEQLHSSQYGFLQGRYIVQALGELEHGAVAVLTSLWSMAGVGGCSCCLSGVAGSFLATSGPG
eukprot:2900250-Amphidinium_carterae.1